MLRTLTLVGLTCCSALLVLPVGAQMNQTSAFLGTWCAQGDPDKRASIVANGPFLTLTNEVGSTSSGHVFGLNSTQIIADQWDLVRGTISGDGKTISWTNGTFWSRCSGHRHIHLQGTWFFGGDRSKPCHIEQHGRSLSLTNESGQTATGSFTGRYAISTVWSGTTITGTVTRDRKRILWSNGTYWTR